MVKDVVTAQQSQIIVNIKKWNKMNIYQSTNQRGEKENRMK